jgi:hypothetical protein
VKSVIAPALVGATVGLADRLLVHTTAWSPGFWGLVVIGAGCYVIGKADELFWSH